MTAPQDFRVLIAGGGIAGLTLANTLQRIGVDYLLLEAREDIAPQVGAAFSVLPNGARILDQMGMFDDVLALAEPIAYDGLRDEHGELVHPKGDTVTLLKARTGYATNVIDRYEMLLILYKHITEKEKILTGKRIQSVEHSERGVTVLCTDSSYRGNVLIGADGVWSTTKKEMWRLANDATPGIITEQEKNCLTAEYRGLFCKVDSIPGIDPGSFDVTLKKRNPSLVIAGQGGRLWVALYEHMGKVHHRDDIPRFTSADAEFFAEKYANYKLRPNISFSDVWKRKNRGFLATVEEGDFSFWTWGRIACMGDSVHKVTPNAGEGGNMAIEDAAVLANAIRAMLDRITDSRPSYTDIQECLASYQSIRKDRASAITKASNELSRVQGLETFSRWFMAKYLIRVRDFGADGISEAVIGAPKLDFLPVPVRSIRGVTMPFNPKQGLARQENRRRRFFIALPILALAYLVSSVMDTTPSLPSAHRIIDAEGLQSSSDVVRRQSDFHGIGWLKNIWRPMILHFAPRLCDGDTASRLQLTGLMADVGLFVSIMLLEGARRANILTLVQLPLLFCMLFQLQGIGKVHPVYLLLHYIASPIEVFKATDQRLTDLRHTMTILPALVSCYYVPALLSLFTSSSLHRQYWGWVWKMFPVWLYAVQNLLVMMLSDSTKQNRLKAPNIDLPMIKLTVGICTAMSSVVWLCLCFNATISGSDIPMSSSLPQKDEGVVPPVGKLLQSHGLLFRVNNLLWLGLLFWDLKHARMITQSWFRIVSYALIMTVVLGPGTVIGLGWLWREHVLANKRHWAAVTEESMVSMEGKSDGDGDVK